MTVLRKFVIRDADIRERAKGFIAALPLDHLWEVTITEYKDTKSKAQERMYHAQIDDIAPYFEFMGQRGWPAEDVKRLLIDAFARARAEEGRPLKQMDEPRIVPSIDGKGTVMLGAQSRRFTQEEAADFIEFLYAYGAQLGVRWREVRDYREAA